MLFTAKYRRESVFRGWRLSRILREYPWTEEGRIRDTFQSSIARFYIVSFPRNHRLLSLSRSNVAKLERRIAQTVIAERVGAIFGSHREERGLYFFRE